jgi:hypothetical protein
MRANMPRIPSSQPVDSSRCDVRLPDAALAYRRRNGLTDFSCLRSANITAWLYRDTLGVEGIQVSPNTTIQELVAQFGPADTPDAEVGIHSEAKAAEWFRERPDLRVLQIFSERIPCPYMCAPLLRHYFPGVPLYYYYDRRSWRGSGGMSAADVLKAAYGL